MEIKQSVARKTSTLTFDQISYLEKMLQKGGPEEKEYYEFAKMVSTFNEEVIEKMRNILYPLLKNPNTVQGYAFTKPLGYAGDFMMIEKIYQKEVSTNPMYQKWDIWWQKSHAATAVRNRKEYFLGLMRTLEAKSMEPKRILILGSGPATDVHEYLTKNPNSRITFDLLDLDTRAIEYAQNKNKAFEEKLNFYRINVLRFNTHKRYDMIWSAGLFDYFKEKHFIYLVKKYLKLLNEDGEMVVGNFSENNPTRNLQEAFSDWYLNYRSSEELMRIASKSGIKEGDVTIEQEPLGINLFMRIKIKKEIQIKPNTSIPDFEKYSEN
jgi:SAM-dependent methyltransferase